MTKFGSKKLDAIYYGMWIVFISSMIYLFMEIMNYVQ